MLLYYTQELPLSTLAKYFIRALKPRLEINDDGWLNAVSVSKEKVLEALYEEMFADEPLMSKRIFKEELLPEIYTHMCGETEDVPVGPSSILDSFLANEEIQEDFAESENLED